MYDASADFCPDRAGRLACARRVLADGGQGWCCVMLKMGRQRQHSSGGRGRSLLWGWRRQRCRQLRQRCLIWQRGSRLPKPGREQRHQVWAAAAARRAQDPLQGLHVPHQLLHHLLPHPHTHLFEPLPTHRLHTTELPETLHCRRGFSAGGPTRSAASDLSAGMSWCCDEGCCCSLAACGGAWPCSGLPAEACWPALGAATAAGPGCPVGTPPPTCCCASLAAAAAPSALGSAFGAACMCTSRRLCCCPDAPACPPVLPCPCWHALPAGCRDGTGAARPSLPC